MSQNIQLVKLGLNYKWGANPLLWNDAAPVARAVVRDAPAPLWLAGWDGEGGARYFGSWGRFQKDLGVFTSRDCRTLRRFRDLPIPTCKQIPANCSAASTVRGGFSSKASSAPASNNGGRMNDEDFGIPLEVTFAAYSNTISSVTGTINTVRSTPA